MYFEYIVAVLCAAVFIIVSYILFKKDKRKGSWLPMEKEEYFKEEYKNNKPILWGQKVYKLIEYYIHFGILLASLAGLMILALDLPYVLTGTYKTITGEVVDISQKGGISVQDSETGEIAGIGMGKAGLELGQIITVEYWPSTRSGRLAEIVEE